MDVTRRTTAIVTRRDREKQCHSGGMAGLKELKHSRDAGLNKSILDSLPSSVNISLDHDATNGYYH